MQIKIILACLVLFLAVDQVMIVRYFLPFEQFLMEKNILLILRALLYSGYTLIFAKRFQIT